MIKIYDFDRRAVVRTIGTAFLCAVLALSLVWPTPSRAQDYTVAELQSLLNQILAQLNQINGVSVSSACPFVWTRSLGQGSTGSDVMRLQQFLNSSSDTALAVSGVGSSGMETQYYGPLTAAAVSKFQVKYRSQILTPLGLVNPTGYFGPSSMAQANRLCAISPGIPPSDDDRDLEGGAGSISDIDLIPGISNEEVGEGEDDVEVFGLELTAEGSDLEFRAVTLDFDPQAGAGDDFDDYAEEVSIWLDGEEYARADADEFDDDNGHRRTITLDRGAIVREGDVGELIVAITGVDNLDSEDEGDRYEVRVDSVRFADAQGAVVTDGSMDGLSRKFSFVEFAESTGLGFVVRNGDDEINDSRSIAVSADDRTDDEPVLSFVIETEGESDLSLEDLRVSVATTGGDLDDLVSAAYLYMDGRRVGSESIDSDADFIVFNDIDLDLEAEENYDFEVRFDFEEADGNYASGATIDVDITSTDRDAWNVEDEQGDDVDDSDRRGSASADAHTLVTEGATLRFISSKTNEVYNSSNPSASYGQFRMVVEVKAIGDTIYVAESATRSDTASAAAGATYYFQNSSGNEYVGGVGSQSFSRISGGNMENGYVRISEGQTARFELVATIDSTDFGQYRAQLVSVGWNDTAAAPDSYTLATPASNYRTGLQTISD